MLRIKQGVDLKELEKFGFYKNEIGEYYHKKLYMKDFYINADKTISIDGCDWTDGKIEDVLYDLITENIVEKVEK